MQTNSFFIAQLIVKINKKRIRGGLGTDGSHWQAQGTYGAHWAYGALGAHGVWGAEPPRFRGVWVAKPPRIQGVWGGEASPGMWLF